MKCDLCTHTGNDVKPYEYETYDVNPEKRTTHLCTHHALYWGYLKGESI